MNLEILKPEKVSKIVIVENICYTYLHVLQEKI